MTQLRRVTLAGGIELDVWEEGPRDAPALIFLHGFPENHRTWRHQITHLSGRYRCIAPDQRGYGHSSRPADVGAYAAPALVLDIFELAAALEAVPFTVIGHDWGGALAWGIAAQGEEAGIVERLGIANAPHPAVFQRLLHSDPAQRTASQYIRAFRDSANDALVREHGLGALLAKAIRWTGNAPYPPEELALLAQQWANPDRAFAMLNWYRASAIDVPDADAALATAPAIDWPRLAMPTLVVWGEQDQALLPANLDGLEDYVADLTVERIADAGHFIPWEAPNAVNAALDRFLAAGR